MVTDATRRRKTRRLQPCSSVPSADCSCAARQTAPLAQSGNRKRRLPIMSMALMLLCSTQSTAADMGVATSSPTKWFEDVKNLPPPLPQDPLPPTPRPTHIPISEKEEQDWLLPDDTPDAAPYEVRPLDEDPKIVQLDGHWASENAVTNRKKGIEYQGGRDGKADDEDVSDSTRRRAPAGMTAMFDLYTYGKGTLTNHELVRFRAAVGATLGPFICDMYRAHGEVTTSCDLTAKGMDVTIEHIVGPAPLRGPDITLYAPAGHAHATRAPTITVTFRVIFGDCSLGTQAVLRDLPKILKSQLRDGQIFALLSDIDHPLEAVGLAEAPIVISCRPEIKLAMPQGFKILDSPVQCKYDGNKLVQVHRNADYWKEHHFFCKHYVDARGLHKCACKTWLKAQQTVSMKKELAEERNWSPPTLTPTLSPTKWHLKDESKQTELAKVLASMPTPAPTMGDKTLSGVDNSWVVSPETAEKQEAADVAAVTKIQRENEVATHAAFTGEARDLDGNPIPAAPTRSPTWSYQKTNAPTATPATPAPMPVSCMVSVWKSEFGSTGKCSMMCGGGVREEKRVILRYPHHGGKACPGASELRRRAACNTAACTPSPTDAPTLEPTGFSAYSEFAHQVGLDQGEDMQNRYATTDKPTPAPTAMPTPAAVDCKLSAWGAWTDCSVSCGGGRRTRNRIALAPGNQWGLQCDDSKLGGLSRREACNLYPCQINNAISFEVKLPSLSAESLRSEMKSKGITRQDWHSSVVKKVAALLGVGENRVQMQVRSAVERRRRLLEGEASIPQSSATAENNSGLMLVFTVLAPVAASAATDAYSRSANPREKSRLTPLALSQEVSSTNFGGMLSTALEQALMLDPGALGGSNAAQVVTGHAMTVHVDEKTLIQLATKQSMTSADHKAERDAWVKHTQVPINCDVSPFSKWTQCTKTCGGTHHLTENSDGTLHSSVDSSFAKKSEAGGWHLRSRVVIRSPMFGGLACPSLSQQMPCNRIPCDQAQRRKQTHHPTYPPTRGPISQRSVSMGGKLHEKTEIGHTTVKGYGSNMTLLDSVFHGLAPALGVFMVLPTPAPTRYPTTTPTPSPTPSPTPHPTTFPSPAPTPYPSAYPTPYPTAIPTRWWQAKYPTLAPTRDPTLVPLAELPTGPPTMHPTEPFGWGESPAPTASPTEAAKIDCEQSTWSAWTVCPVTCSQYAHTGQQTRYRTTIATPLHGGSPCGSLTDERACIVGPCPETSEPTPVPTTSTPTSAPTLVATAVPTDTPTKRPTAKPTSGPTRAPTASTAPPTGVPTAVPTLAPSPAPKLCKCHGATPCLFEDGQTCIAKQYMLHSHRCPPKTDECYCPCADAARPCFKRVAKSSGTTLGSKAMPPGFRRLLESVNFAVSTSHGTTVVSGAVHECLALTTLHEVEVCPTESFRCNDPEEAAASESTPPSDYLGNGIVQIGGSGR